MKTLTRPMRLVVGGAAVLALLVTGGAALGAWQGSGAGSGAADTGTTADVTLSPGTPTADLYPGGAADVVLVVTNPNRSPVTISSLALDPAQGLDGFAVDAAHVGCATSSFAFTAQPDAGPAWVVPGRTGTVDGTLEITLPGSLAMASSAANACQDVTVTVYLRAGP